MFNLLFRISKLVKSRQPWFFTDQFFSSLNFSNFRMKHFSSTGENLPLHSLSSPYSSSIPSTCSHEIRLLTNYQVQSQISPSLVCLPLLPFALTPPPVPCGHCSTSGVCIPRGFIYISSVTGTTLQLGPLVFDLALLSPIFKCSSLIYV